MLRVLFAWLMVRRTMKLGAGVQANADSGLTGLITGSGLTLPALATAIGPAFAALMTILIAIKLGPHYLFKWARKLIGAVK